MPFLPYVPTAAETDTEARIVAMSKVTDETLRWIVTLYMAGYHTSASETVRKVSHALANMAALPDPLIPQELSERIRDIAYGVLGEMVAQEAAAGTGAAGKPAGRSGDGNDAGGHGAA